MKKILGMTLVLTLILGVSFAYACGEKKASAEAMKASAETSKANSATCASEKVDVTAASAQVMPAVAVEKTGLKSDACASGATAMKTGAGCCASKAKAANADAKVMKADAKYCPVSSDCPHPCVKDDAQIEKMKAELNQQPEVTAISSQSEASCHSSGVNEKVEKSESKDDVAANVKAAGMASSVKETTPESGSLK